MSDTRETRIVYDAIDELNEQYAEENQLAKTLDTALLGDAGRLDSVGFVNLIALVEEKCQDEFGVCISLTNDLETEGDNALKTVGSFIDYVCRVVEKKVSDGKATGRI